MMAEHVILLHGLARSSASLRKLAKALRQAGYQVHVPDYRSTRMPVETAAETVIGGMLDQYGQSESCHFVSYSLGGILLRYYLSRHRVPSLGRVVMIAPPNHGSELADRLGGLRLIRCVFGPAVAQLGTRLPASLPRRLPPADFHPGIIAGSSSINPLGRCWLSPPHDGTVTVASTRLDGMADHRVVRATHPFIMNHSEVIAQTLYFLRHGRFSRAGKMPGPDRR